MKNEENVKLELINLNDVVSKPVKYLWQPYIPLGKVGIIQGNPGVGKTTLITSLMADLSRGNMLPGDVEPREPINIIYNTVEDDLGDTIKPNLVLAGADCSKIDVINVKNKDLSLTDSRIEQAIVEKNVKLMVFDPIQGYIGSSVDFHRANEVRPVLSHLTKLAEKYECAILLVGHLNKNAGQLCAYRGLGSIDFFAAVRSVMLVGTHPSDNTQRFLFHAKSNLSKPGDTRCFRINENKLEWTGTIDLNADQFMLDGGETVKKVDSAKAFLMDFLADGEKPSTEIYEAADQEDFSKRTLATAKKDLKIKALKHDDKWFWRLPE